MVARVCSVIVVAAMMVTAGLAQASATSPRITSLNLCYDHLDVHGTLQPTRAHGGRLEAILNFAPDMVLANPFSDPFLIARLHAHEIEVVRLPEPESLAELDAFYRYFDDLLGAQPRQWTQLWRDKGVLMLQANHYSFGKGTLWHDVVEALGGENLAPGRGLVTVLPEQVLALNPDVVVVLEQEGFALAGRNQLHGALAALLEERAVYVRGELVGCMAQRLDELIEALHAGYEP